MSAHESDRARYLRRLFLATILATTSLVPAPTGMQTASAEGCPDVEVVFARGTFEPPGVGTIGESFADQLRAQPQLAGKSVDVYPVNYPASLDFSTAADGVIDAGNRVRDMTARCPTTKMVLGGYSQGAAVVGYVTADKIPEGYITPNGITGPLPPEIADHVAAVALFGKPSNGFLNSIDRTAPPINVGSRYGPKTIDECVPDDPVCSPTGGDNNAHMAYADNGMTTQAATFAAQQVGITAAVNTASR
jgi:cutinase